MPLRTLIVGLPLGAFSVMVLIIDDVRDRHFDAAKGWRTGPIRFGMTWSRVEYLFMVGFAYLVPFWFWLRWGFGIWVLLPLITLPFAALLPMTPLAALLWFVYATLLAVGLAL
jgi:1,4-dihydroxy-2-naphthoate octaprenyltransferase